MEKNRNMPASYEMPTLTTVYRGEPNHDPTKSCKKAETTGCIMKIMLREVRVFSLNELTREVADRDVKSDAVRRAVQGLINVGLVDTTDGGWVISGEIRIMHRDAVRSMEKLQLEAGRQTAAYSDRGSL